MTAATMVGSGSGEVTTTFEIVGSESRPADSQLIRVLQFHFRSAIRSLERILVPIMTARVPILIVSIIA